MVRLMLLQEPLNSMNSSYRCECAHCSIMNSREECICCKEIDVILDKVTELNNPSITCITQHPGFSSVCLNVWVLQTACIGKRMESPHHYQHYMSMF